MTAKFVSESDERLAEARILILNHGWNETAYQILNPGIRLWFSQSKDAVVGYVDSKKIRMVAGAPICETSRLMEVCKEFEVDSFLQAECSVCYFAAGGQLEKILTSHIGYSRILLGAQPIWHPTEWPSILESNASLRAQLNRAKNKGVRVGEWPTSKAAKDAGIQRCLEEWISKRTIPTMHFLVEPNTLERLWDRRIFVAEKNDIAVGFLVATPIPSRQGWLIEQIIRGHNAPNGTAELLLNFVFEVALRENFQYFTLGLSPLCFNTHGIENQKSENPRWMNMIFGWAKNYGNGFYNFKGLEHFKSKFQPHAWEPIYAIYNRPKLSLKLLFAFASVFTGRPFILVFFLSLFRRFFVPKTSNRVRVHF